MCTLMIIAVYPFSFSGSATFPHNRQQTLHLWMCKYEHSISVLLVFSKTKKLRIAFLPLFSLCNYRSVFDMFNATCQCVI